MKKLVSLLLALALCLSLASFASAEGEWEYKEATISMMVGNDQVMTGIDAVLALAKEKLGITVEIENRVDESVLKTRLAAGEATDIVSYNCGALLVAQNPAAYFLSLNDHPEITDRLDDGFEQSVTVNGVTYGVPIDCSNAGCILYWKPLYEELGLEIPKTWDEFLANCEVIKNAGYNAILSADAKTSSTQLIFLGDFYNVMAEDPTFVTEFEAGRAKYATNPAAFKSWQKYETVLPYLQDGHEACGLEDGLELFASGSSAHWIYFSSILGNLYDLYGSEVTDNVGIFAIPGDDPENTGITVWQPEAFYINKNSEKIDDCLRFLEFYISDEALDAYTEAVVPHGAMLVKGYTIKNTYPAVANDLQAYFDAGRTCSAQEFISAVKGANCRSFTGGILSGLYSATEAAALYDEDCKLQAVQLGLDWE